MISSFFRFMSYLPELNPITGICERYVSKSLLRSSILVKKRLFVLELQEFSLVESEKVLSEDSSSDSALVLYFSIRS